MICHSNNGSFQNAAFFIWVKRMAIDSLMSTYARLPVTFTRGEGAWLYDEQQKPYLDALSGIAVCGLGHCHPAVTQALCQQAATLVHTSNIYHVQKQAELAEALCELSGMSRVFFGNSGAEANEAAIKLARLHGHARGIEVPTIIVMENSFHGRTLATLTATGNPKVQLGFEPLVQGFVRVPFDDIAVIKAVRDSNPNICAILLEPIQGEGGIHIPASTYLNELRQLCDDNQWLLMLDEVQTGNGRTGHYFCYQHNKILPDVVTTAKGLGNGFPIGACLASGPAAELFKPGNHGSTYGGNPLACATALAVVTTLKNERLIQRATALGERIADGLRKQLATCNQVKTIRHSGLMLGVEMDRPCADLVKIALDKGLLINVTANKVIRVLPPLILSDAEADELVLRLAKSIGEFVAV